MRKEIHISILGDICPARGFRIGFDREDEALIFGDVLPFLQQADVTIANLECPLSNYGHPATKTGPCLSGKESDAVVLNKAGIDVVSLANNHILDYGQDAFVRTLEALDTASVAHFGAAKDPETAKAPFFVRKNGWTLGILAFAEEEFSIVSEDRGGAHLFDPYLAFDQIRDVRKQCDYLLILYHGGIEDYEYPSPLLQKKCRKMVEAGADLVICQHSHCIGTLESYQNGTILYGQGNAIFGRIEGDSKWNQGLLVTLILSEEGSSISYSAFEAGVDGIMLMPDSDKRIERMRTDSEKLSDPQFVKNQWDKFCTKREAACIPELIGWGRIRNKANRLLKNRLVNYFISKRKKMVMMNLIRCDAHREVIQTILENSQNED